jgi:hypothetical protein
MELSNSFIILYKGHASEYEGRGTTARGFIDDDMMIMICFIYPVEVG